MNTGSSLNEKISRFFNPPTQVENDKRKKQLRDTALFVVGTAMLVYFRKNLEESLANIGNIA